MVKTVRLLLLLLAALWQPLVYAGPMEIAQALGDLDHLVTHAQQSSHHHHADQSLHWDDADDAPSQHLHADTSAPSVGMVSQGHGAPAVPAAGAPLELALVPWCAPLLDGPLRPPQRRA